jgi:hypothetical protein
MNGRLGVHDESSHNPSTGNFEIAFDDSAL